MFCTYIYSKIAKKWVVSFYDDDGIRNNRKAEFFDRELDATNRICELMAIENIKYIPPTFENRIISAIYNAIIEYEIMETYTDCEEYRRQGAINALEELVERLELIKKDV